MKVALIIVAVVLVALFLVTLYSCLVVSSRCSMEEEKRDGK